jgi:hypothetical protein
MSSTWTALFRFVAASLIVISVAHESVAQPVNDNFASATVIATLPFTDTVSTVGATKEVGEPSGCGFVVGCPLPCDPSTTTVWYSFTPATNMTLIADTFGSGFDTILSVYTASSLVDCSDDAVGLQSTFTFVATGGTTYYFQVGGHAATAGTLTFNLNALPPFAQCPPIGMANSCNDLITVNQGGCVNFQIDPSQLFTEGLNDTVVGLQNNSGAPLCSITFNDLNPNGGDGPFSFMFPGEFLDGICSGSVSPQAPGCPFGPTTYEGPWVTFSAIHPHTGTVSFSPCIPIAGSTYFGLDTHTGIVGSCNDNGVCDAGCGETCTNCPDDCDCPHDHFKCYKVSDRKLPPFVPTTKPLTDQFESKSTLIRKPVNLCNPVDKNNEGIYDPTAHLTCYKIKDASGQPKFAGVNVQVTNQFGTLRLRARKAALFCDPSEKNGVYSTLKLNHFKCYKVRDLKQPKFQPLNVTLSDQFEGTTTLVKKPAFLCNPVQYGNFFRDPRNHLTCYKIKDVASFAGTNVQVVGSADGGPLFGPDPLQLKVKKGTSGLLCVPSTKTVLP